MTMTKTYVRKRFKKKLVNEMQSLKVGGECDFWTPNAPPKPNTETVTVTKTYVRKRLKKKLMTDMQSLKSHFHLPDLNTSVLDSDDSKHALDSDPENANIRCAAAGMDAGAGAGAGVDADRECKVSTLTEENNVVGGGFDHMDSNSIIEYDVGKNILHDHVKTSSHDLQTHLLPSSTPTNSSPNHAAPPGHNKQITQEMEKEGINVVYPNPKKRKEDGIDLNKTPHKRPKKKIYRPKVIGHPAQPKTPKRTTSQRQRSSIEPCTPKLATPKRVSSKKTMLGKRTEPVLLCKRSLNIDIEKNLDLFGVCHSTSMRMSLNFPILYKRKRMRRFKLVNRKQNSKVGSLTPQLRDLDGEGVNVISEIALRLNGSHVQKFDQNGHDMIGSHQGLIGQDQNADFPLSEHCPIVPYGNIQDENQDDACTKNGILVPVQHGQHSIIKKSKKQAALEIYFEDVTAWRLQLKKITNVGEEKLDEETNETLERERALFYDRIKAFTARIHTILGDRRFSPWKGSVVDSVVGVFLTQNVSDTLSSSAFMSLAAKFPAQPSIREHHNTFDIQESIKTKEKKNENQNDWDELRRTWSRNGERNNDHKDSVNWEAVRHADASEIADAIKARGQHNVIADRIKEFLDRVVRLHKNIDLEWLRHAPPDKVKEYLLEFNGLGLKSVECIRLLGLQHVAFPVDTNVGRIAIRLGWVPLEPLPEELHIHLLQQYPIMDSIQKYLWPRLSSLDQKTLYELHYQLITFGKVYCTKRNPNCNSCPMRGDCRHFASAYASARRALPGPVKKEKETSTTLLEAVNSPGIAITEVPLSFLELGQSLGSEYQTKNCEPIIEEPASPEPMSTELCRDIEDFAVEDDSNEIPTIRLDGGEFRTNLERLCKEMKDMALQDNEVSRALVALSPQVAIWPVPKLKHVSRLRTKHLVYELPDSHHLLDGFDRRDPDDPCPYLLAIWTPGETASSSQSSEELCSSQACGSAGNKETCSACNILREQNSNKVRGTILIPCRTAMRGSFPLNGTYFQVNEVFADYKSSEHPVDVPREWLWNLPRRVVYCGTSVTAIFRDLSTEEIQHCFWNGFVCMRAFDRETRTPKRLVNRLHVSSSQAQAGKSKKKTMEEDE